MILSPSLSLSYLSFFVKACNGPKNCMPVRKRCALQIYQHYRKCEIYKRQIVGNFKRFNTNRNLYAPLCASPAPAHSSLPSSNAVEGWDGLRKFVCVCVWVFVKGENKWRPKGPLWCREDLPSAENTSPTTHALCLRHTHTHIHIRVAKKASMIVTTSPPLSSFTTPPGGV